MQCISVLLVRSGLLLVRGGLHAPARTVGYLRVSSYSGASLCTTTALALLSMEPGFATNDELVKLNPEMVQKVFDTLLFKHEPSLPPWRDVVELVTTSARYHPTLAATFVGYFPELKSVLFSTSRIHPLDLLHNPSFMRDLCGRCGRRSRGKCSFTSRVLCALCQRSEAENVFSMEVAHSHFGEAALQLHFERGVRDGLYCYRLRDSSTFAMCPPISMRHWRLPIEGQGSISNMNQIFDICGSQCPSYYDLKSMPIRVALLSMATGHRRIRTGLCLVCGFETTESCGWFRCSICERCHIDVCGKTEKADIAQRLGILVDVLDVQSGSSLCNRQLDDFCILSYGVDSDLLPEVLALRRNFARTTNSRESREEAYKALDESEKNLVESAKNIADQIPRPQLTARQFDKMPVWRWKDNGM